MKELGIIALVCVIASILAVSLTVIIFTSILPHHESYGGSPSGISYIKGVTKSNGYYDISLLIPSVSNVTASERLDNFGINQISQEDLPDLIIHINGTAVDTSNPLRYNLKSCDSLQINLIVPCTNYASGSTINVCLWGDPILWSEPVVLQ
jgi:hypothetical protein